MTDQTRASSAVPAPSGKGSSGAVGHEQDCPARYGCCPNDEYGCPIHIPPPCNCGHEQADSDD